MHAFRNGEPYPVRTRVTAPAIHNKIVVKGGLLFSTLKPYTYERIVIFSF